MELKTLLERYEITENDLEIGFTNFKNKYQERFNSFEKWITERTYQNLRTKANLTRKYNDLRKKHYYSELNNNDFSYVFSIDGYDFNKYYSVIRLAILRKYKNTFKYDNSMIFEVFKKKTSQNLCYYHHSESIDDIYRLVIKAKKHLKLENNEFLVFSDNSKAFMSFRKLYDLKFNCNFSSNKQHKYKLEQIHQTLRTRFPNIDSFDSFEKIKNYLENNYFNQICLKHQKIAKNLK